MNSEIKWQLDKLDIPATNILVCMLLCCSQRMSLLGRKIFANRRPSIKAPAQSTDGTVIEAANDKLKSSNLLVIGRENVGKTGQIKIFVLLLKPQTYTTPCLSASSTFGSQPMSGVCRKWPIESLILCFPGCFRRGLFCSNPWTP